jgi:nucleoside-diphosphate-sugar epimerase
VSATHPNEEKPAKRIAVTGGSGAIGTYVCDELIKAGHDVTSLDLVPPRADVGFIETDLTILNDTREAIAGFDQVVHLAAIPDPYGGDPPERVIGVNTVISYNVFEAARLGDVKRIIYGCSDSSTGFGIHHANLTPHYIPIDEQHPLWPHETYSLSKHFGERIGANYAKAFGLEVISLRYMWVWTQRIELEILEEIVARARAGAAPETVDNFGAHIAVRDVARACAAAAKFKFAPSGGVPFEAVFLAAKNTYYAVPTLTLVEAFCGQCPPVKDTAYFEDNPTASVFDIRKAQRLLGWEPQLDWRNFEEWEL